MKEHQHAPQEIWRRGYRAAHEDLDVPVPVSISAPPGLYMTSPDQKKIWALGYQAGRKTIPAKQ